MVALPFWVDPYSNARKQADAWLSTRPADAELMERIASRSQADWFGDWNRDIETAVRDRVTQIAGAGSLAVLVAYNIPIRDCSGYSGGGATSPDAYRSWIRALAAGIGDRSAAVILEPDALALMDCLSAEQRATRLALLKDAVQVLEARPNVAVYLDAGHAAWHDPATIGARLREAGIDAARGFAINTSNFQTTAAGLTYGDAVSAEVGGKHYVIDTSRNGLGPTSDNQWCNPPGRGLGNNPTPYTGHALADAFLWIKRPGESDGTCNGGPTAGSWWADYALELARNQPTVVASSE
ncbi:MAG: glycoside hydrolase family 6 protein [Gemmatimonadetes bacterium]|nr:glycoside hydrolase family 6 protein [Gemmatimonadota bacterium]